MESTLEITATSLKQQLDNGHKLHLIDVRTPEEYSIANIPGSLPIPMDQIPASLQKLEGLADEHPLVVICHHGVRSMHVTNWLRAQGIENCSSLQGGIERWSIDVDRSVPRY